MLCVLGLDPGTATTGYGIVQEMDDGALVAVAYGVITTKAAAPMPERLHKIYQDVTALIQKHQPQQMAIEQLFFWEKRNNRYNGCSSAGGFVAGGGASWFAHP